MGGDGTDAEQLGNLGKLEISSISVGIQETTQCQPWKNAETRHYDVRPLDITGIRLVIKGTDDQSILRLYEFTPEFGTNPSPEWDAKVARVLRD